MALTSPCCLLRKKLKLNADLNKPTKKIARPASGQTSHVNNIKRLAGIQTPVAQKIRVVDQPREEGAEVASLLATSHLNPVRTRATRTAPRAGLNKAKQKKTQTMKNQYRTQIKVRPRSQHRSAVTANLNLAQMRRAP